MDFLEPEVLPPEDEEELEHPKGIITPFQLEVYLNRKVRKMGTAEAARRAGSKAKPDSLRKITWNCVKNVESWNPQIRDAILRDQDMGPAFLAGKLKELCNATTLIKRRDASGEDELVEVTDNRNQLEATRTVIELLDGFPPKRTEHFEMTFEERLLRLDGGQLGEEGEMIWPE